MKKYVDFKKGGEDLENLDDGDNIRSLEKHIDVNLMDSKLQSRPNLEDSPEIKKIRDMSHDVKE